MARTKKECTPVNYVVAYWINGKKVYASDMTEEQQRVAITNASTRALNAYYGPKGYKIYAPDMPDIETVFPA